MPEGKNNMDGKYALFAMVREPLTFDCIFVDEFQGDTLSPETYQLLHSVIRRSGGEIWCVRNPRAPADTRGHLKRWVQDWLYVLRRKFTCPRGWHYWELDGEGNPWCYCCGMEYD